VATRAERTRLNTGGPMAARWSGCEVPRRCCHRGDSQSGFATKSLVIAAFEPRDGHGTEDPMAGVRLKFGYNTRKAATSVGYRTPCLRAFLRHGCCLKRKRPANPDGPGGARTHALEIIKSGQTNRCELQRTERRCISARSSLQRTAARCRVWRPTFTRVLTRDECLWWQHLGIREAHCHAATRVMRE